MTKVKICGITNSVDADLAVEYGADALGFIFYPPSPRNIIPADAREIISRLPPFVNTVAVMVEPTAEQINECLAISSCRVLQIYGKIPDSWLPTCPVIRVCSVANADDLSVIADFNAASAILLDTRVADLYGGSGKVFDWLLAIQAKQYHRLLILAGGLTPDNIRTAISTVAPYAVDVNSGVERYPGKKDAQLLRKLFTEIRR